MMSGGWVPASTQKMAECRRLLAKVSRPDATHTSVTSDTALSFYDELELEHLSGLTLRSRQNLCARGYFPAPRQTSQGPRWHRADIAEWLTHPPAFLLKTLQPHWAKTFGLK